MPPNPHPVEVTGKPLVTAGRVQLLVDCPRCGAIHRHLDAGARRSPCGATYVVTSVPPTAPTRHDLPLRRGAS